MSKELDRKLRKKLESEEKRLKQKEKHENRYIDGAIIFFGTLIPLYLLFFAVNFIFMFFFGSAISLLGVSAGWVSPIIHGAIWVAALISVFRKRSVLEEMIHWF